MAERVGLYPGTFDPVTNGHLDVIHRAARLLDRLVIGVAINIGKGPLFPLEERVELVRAEAETIAARTGCRIEVRPFEGLLIGFAHEVGAQMIVRGLRAVTDFDYEFQMTGMNRRLDPKVETVFLMASSTRTTIARSSPTRPRTTTTTTRWATCATPTTTMTVSPTPSS